MRSLRLIFAPRSRASIPCRTRAVATACLGDRSAADDTLVSRATSRPASTYRQFIDTRGPFVVDLVRVDLRRADLELRARARARRSSRAASGRRDMVRRVDQRWRERSRRRECRLLRSHTGENENNQVIDGEWWKGLKVTDSPYDTYDNAHVQFALDARDAAARSTASFSTARRGRDGMATPIITVNFNPSGNPEGTALYTSRFGATTPRDTTRQTAEAPLRRRWPPRRYAALRATRRRSRQPPVRRFRATARCSPPTARVCASNEVQAMADGDTVKVLLTTLPRCPRGAAPALRHRRVAAHPARRRRRRRRRSDGRRHDLAQRRDAASAHRGRLLARQRDALSSSPSTAARRSSGGMTLVELAAIDAQLGAWQAMNFDGGGSTTMVVDGAVVNVPSDSTGERAVGSALLLLRKR